MDKAHGIIVKAVLNEGEAWLQVRCACGVFVMDRKGDVTLPDITGAVTLHYLQAANPKLSNGERPKLIEGKK